MNKSPIAVKLSQKDTTGDSLRHLAFDNSFHANIISIVHTGKIIMVNKAACRLLGYSKKELLFKKRSDIFDTSEKSFKKMLKERRAEGHAIAFVTAIRKNLNTIPCEITSSVFAGEHGIEKSIITIADIRENILKQKNIDIKKDKIVADNIVLAQAKSDARLAENNAWIRHIAEASYDVMWDWDLMTGKVYVGESIKEVFGYTAVNNTMNFTEFQRYLLPEEKTAVEKKLWKTLTSGSKSWNDSYKFKRMDGSIAHTTSRASIVRDEKGKAIRLIGATKDISMLKELEKKLKEQIAIQKDQSEKFLLAAKISFDGIWDWNLLTNDFFLGEGFEELFGYAVKSTAGSVMDWSKHLHPDDKLNVEKGLKGAIDSSASHWEHAYRFIKADGSIANVFGRASIIRDAKGKAYRMIGAIHDIGKQKVLEEKLEQEIKLKEKQIADATEEAREMERSDIGRELHDNVNQLLGASRLYLSIAKQGGKNSEAYFSRSSEYTLSAIEEIRKLTKALTTDVIKNLGLCESIENMVRDTMEINPIKISFSLKSFKEGNVTDKFKLNIFRIVQEQLNNILKHAKANKIILILSQSKDIITLSISDNGIGFDTTKRRNGIGVDNIKSRAAYYNGIADFVSEPGKGCTLIIKFAAKDLLINRI